MSMSICGQQSLLLLLLCQLLTVLVLPASAALAKQPHIVLIVVDDMGHNDVSWHNSAVVMPSIDRLARSGVILDQSYVLPVCSPTRSALLTGRYPYTIGRQSSALKPLRPTGLTLNVTLLPEALKQVGYSTHMVGKWHLGFCKWEYTPTYRGFDSFLGFYLGGQGYFSHVRQHIAKMERGRKIRVSGYDQRLGEEPFFPDEDEYSTVTHSRRACSIINSHDPSRPLFLYLPFQAVHGPVEAPPEYQNLYKDVRDNKRSTFLGMVTALDVAVGEIVDALQTSGLYDNTVIVFTSDNGGGVKSGGNNWPLKGHKSTLWEGGTRAPAFVHSLLLANTGTLHKGLVHAVDWFPTLAGLAGAAVPSDLDGLDQWGSIGRTAASPRRQIVYNIADVRGKLKAAIRLDDHKLVLGERRGNEWIPPTEGESFRVSTTRINNFYRRVSKTMDNFQGWTQLSSTSVFGEPNATVSVRQLLEREAETREQDALQSRADDYEFPLPMLADYDDGNDEEAATEVENYSYDVDGGSSDDVDCSLLSRKECRRSRKQLKNLRSYTKVDDFFKKNLGIKLYDLKTDPTERHDLASSRPGVVRKLLRALLQEMPRVVLSDNPPRVSEGDPRNFGGIWSPGWC